VSPMSPASSVAAAAGDGKLASTTVTTTTIRILVTTIVEFRRYVQYSAVAYCDRVGSVGMSMLRGDRRWKLRGLIYRG